MNQSNKENTDWFSLSYEEKNKQLFLRQKKTLDIFRSQEPFHRHSMITVSMT